MHLRDKRYYIGWEIHFLTVDRVKNQLADLSVILLNFKQLIIEVTVCRNVLKSGR